MTKANDTKMIDWYKAARRHRGSINRIAQKADCHRNWVRAVLRGEYRDDTLMLLAAQELVSMESKDSEHKRKMQEMANRMMEVATA